MFQGSVDKFKKLLLALNGKSSPQSGKKEKKIQTILFSNSKRFIVKELFF